MLKNFKMKIDTSLLNHCADHSWNNSGESGHVLSRTETPKSSQAERDDRSLSQCVADADFLHYPSMKMALQNLTSSRIFKDASSHIQFASNINQQKVMAERVSYLTKI
jgi:hypothetical protein